MRLALFVAVVPAVFVVSCSPVGPALCEKEFDCQEQLGLTLEDDTEESVALFITDHAVRTPATAVLYDRAGNERAAHPAFPDMRGHGGTAG